jgi:hypothetical protein
MFLNAMFLNLIADVPTDQCLGGIEPDFGAESPVSSPVASVAFRLASIWRAAGML